jgi:Transglycosylase SLT domain
MSFGRRAESGRLGGTFAMRYLFGCAVLCLGLSAADNVMANPVAAPGDGSEFAAAKSMPAQSVEELEASSRSFDEPQINGPKSEPKRTVSREEICDSVAAAAQAHDLPIAFLASLVWQESRFEPKAVSPVGAQGIAQFMPRISAAYGVADPFDPIQALPASAKFLRELFEQFGNLGLAAAAYNAGPKRVLDWMAKRGKLPAETRTYVLNITGRPADQWVTKIDNTGFKIPARTPCRALASLPEWSSAGSGQLNPDLPDVKDVKEKPMIVITKTKVIVTGPHPKTLAIAQPKTKVAADKDALVKVAVEKVASVKVATAKVAAVKVAAVKKETVAKTEGKAIVVTKSKIVITGAQPKYSFASTQPKSIVAPEPKRRTRVAEQDKKGRIKADVAAAKLGGKAKGKNPSRVAARVRTASTN